MAKTTNKETKDNDKKNEWVELIQSFLIAILLAIIFRSFIYEPFHIPSGSMKPTLYVGDYIFVSKFSYGYSKHSFPFSPPLFEGRIWSETPKRGDVAVFKLPSDPSINYIKRIIGLPGDTVQMINGSLFLNGKPVKRKRVENYVEARYRAEDISVAQYLETLPNNVSYHTVDQYPSTPLDNTTMVTVPKGHYFALGDNRDNSQDSRVSGLVGFIPHDNLVGRASVIFFSTSTSFWRIWDWGSSFRFNRFFSTI